MFNLGLVLLARKAERIFWGWFIFSTVVVIKSYSQTTLRISISSDTTLNVKLSLFNEGHYTTASEQSLPPGTPFIYTYTGTKPSFGSLEFEGVEFPVVINPSETEVYISGNKQSFKQNNVIVWKSEENRCWSKLLRLEGEYGQLLNVLLAQSIKRRSHALDSVILDTQKQFNKQIDKLQNDFKNSFCADVILPNYKMPLKSDLSMRLDTFMILHTLDSIHWNDERLLSCPFFFELLKFYRTKFLPTNTTGQKKFIDAVFKTTDIHPAIRHNLFTLYLQSYALANRGQLVQYLLDANEYTIVDTTTTGGKLVAAVKKLLAGNKVMNVILPDTSGNPVDFASTLKGNDYGMLVFYNHECEHCLELLPRIDSLVKKASRKISVYAVDTHENKTEWEHFVKDHHWNFTHAYLTNDKSNSITDFYLLFSVPIVVLTDIESRIISRFTPFDEMLPYLK